MSEVRFRTEYEQALDKSGLAALTRLVLRVLVGRADWRTGMFAQERYTPSVAALAAATGLTDRAVQKHLQAAAEAGWLVIEKRTGKKSGFTLTIPGVPDEANPDSYETPADITARPVDNPPADNPTPERGSGVPPNVVHPVLTSLTVPSPVRNYLHVGGRDPKIVEREKMIAEFNQGRLYTSRSDVPDLRPCAQKWCRHCRTTGDHPSHLHATAAA